MYNGDQRHALGGGSNFPWPRAAPTTKLFWKMETGEPKIHCQNASKWTKLHIKFENFGVRLMDPNHWGSDVRPLGKGREGGSGV